MSDGDGNIPHLCLRRVKPIILKDANPKILKISELAWDSHENPFSSNSKMLD
jgi:hypothetical protein